MTSVLLIESEIIFGSFLEDALKKCGFDADMALNGTKGWERLLSKKYDIVIMEVFP
ncbi:MAG: hypothetical protein LUF90_07605 [Rikenellaceae bacterium]|nr:hypothetical protein [Rikenellaceae bacterium]